MPISFWIFVTHLGNSMLLVPAALVLALWLVRSGQRHLAFTWMLTFGAAILLVLASKLAFLGWGLGVAAIDFTGISGHSTVSTAVFTMGAWLLASGRSPGIKALAVCIGLCLGVAVSVSRLVLDAHSVSEVIAGLAVGALAALLPMGWPRLSPPRLAHRWVPLALAAALLLPPQVGRPAEAHGIVVKLALLASGRSEVFTRDMLLR